jgi:hypothetical protein
MSSKISCAPGCRGSRRTSSLAPSGQPSASSTLSGKFGDGRTLALVAVLAYCGLPGILGS